MADYADVPVTSRTWTALPAASEPVNLQARGAAIEVTTHSAPDGATEGTLLERRVTMVVPANAVVRYRMAEGAGAYIVRDALLR